MVALWVTPLGGQSTLPPPTNTAAANAIPLFESAEALSFRLIADLEQLKSDRAEDNPERPSRIVVEGVAEAVDVDVRTRGNFRLRRSTCSFPPLRLDFPRRAVAGTVFQGQDKVKLVTFCKDSDRYEQQVLREYMAYRIYNQFTDYSFKVRLAHITYVDELAREDPVTRYGFLIEHEDGLAERLGGEIVETPLFDPRDYPPELMLTTSVFQFMIGNTDWSIAEFHNAVLLRLEDGGFVPVPYDFDFSGLVDASYAVVNPTLGIDSVKDRLYRGFCGATLPYDEVYEDFNSKKDVILDMIETMEPLSGGTRRHLRNYVNGFYRVLESEGRRDREITRSCRVIS